MKMHDIWKNDSEAIAQRRIKVKCLQTVTPMEKMAICSINYYRGIEGTYHL